MKTRQVQCYGIYLSDLSRPHDVRIGRRINRVAAHKIVTCLNATQVGSRSVAQTRGLPLYYCVRESEVGS